MISVKYGVPKVIIMRHIHRGKSPNVTCVDYAFPNIHLKSICSSGGGGGDPLKYDIGMGFSQS